MYGLPKQTHTPLFEPFSLDGGQALLKLAVLTAA